MTTGSLAAIDPGNAERVGGALIEYLLERHRISDARFADPPRQMHGGTDTFIYEFRLDCDSLPDVWRQPLVLRIYSTVEQTDKAERESAVQRFVATRGYPALLPVAVEGPDTPLGLPFMLMERATGMNMLERFARNPARASRLLTVTARAHVALHELSTDECPLPSTPSLVLRQLDRLRAELGPFRSERLRNAFSWLQENARLVEEEQVSLCHGDFHPINLILDAQNSVTVLDWSEATLGDRHYDVARTAVLLWSAPTAARGAIERTILRLSRRFLVWRYLSAYRRLLPIDKTRLRYWKALHAFLAAAQVAALHAGDLSTAGSSGDAHERLPASLQDEFLRYFWREVNRGQQAA